MFIILLKRLEDKTGRAGRGRIKSKGLDTTALNRGSVDVKQLRGETCMLQLPEELLSGLLDQVFRYQGRSDEMWMPGT